MPKILWVGDAVVKTGFEYVSRGFLAQLQQRGWDVVHLGIGYSGDPHTEYTWPVYPTVFDPMGVERLEELIKVEEPDVVMLLNDAWGALRYFSKIPKGMPTVVYPPVDSPNQICGRDLTLLAEQRGIPLLLLCPTQFGIDELRSGGYIGSTGVIGYGIDIKQYDPIPREDARRALGFPQALIDGFIVGNINRNAPRKRIDLTVRAFAEWVNQSHVPDAYLLLHMSPDDHWGWNLPNLAKYYGLDKRLIITGGRKGVTDYVSQQKMRYIYAALNVQISTTVGEGWGIPHMEGMAMGIPQIVPDYSALGEWARGGVTYYGIADHQIQTGQVNTVWAVPDISSLKQELNLDYAFNGVRVTSYRARMHVAQDKFSWTECGRQMDETLRGFLPKKTRKAKQLALELIDGLA